LRSPKKPITEKTFVVLQEILLPLKYFTTLLINLCDATLVVCELLGYSTEIKLVTS